MIFNSHFSLAGRHAFLSASKHAWSNYDEDKLDRMFITAMAAKRGTELHEFAMNAIRLGIKLQGRGTLALYVNDAIGFRMTPEQPLYVSDNCFGHPDAISFRKNKLRIFDLKTGTTHVSFRQLEIYAAMFCIEYGLRPFDIEIELRIYQNDAYEIFIADPDDIFHLMEKTKLFDKRIDEMRVEAMS